ncbi:MAG: type I pullulanase [Mangrovibacterium sp.]
MQNWRFNHIDFSTYPYYGGDDLGVRTSVREVFIKIWAPDAEAVDFFVYRYSEGGRPIRTDSLILEQDGCWSLRLEGDFRGLYYTFRVKQGGWLDETPGVDARAVGTNGRRGLFFIPGETNPRGWELDRQVMLESQTDAIVYELHVRDFSIDPASGMKYRGKFLAFTEEGTKETGGMVTGIDHLKELGITHVHLLPVADFHSVDEKHPSGQYNWGYDPLNFNVPDGFYATDPDGPARITEFKQLVMALHRKGIGVVLDVVYNHTGYTRHSWFNQTVPGYYYRQNYDGSFANASGCGNEIASERAMVRKYILDSVCYWTREFHVDGFRFDLMGILDLDTMNRIREALDRLHPGMLLYGEGWTAAESPMPAGSRAVRDNVRQLNRIACFNDTFRDAVKGDNFSDRELGFVNGNYSRAEGVKLGLVAAVFHPQVDYGRLHRQPLADGPEQTVNYVSAHDNLTLYDKLRLSRPDADTESLKRMHKLAGALLLCAQGVVFLHAGTEFCRTKEGDHNSYRSPDRINRIDWSRKKAFEDVFHYFRSLIQLRRKLPALRMQSAETIGRTLHFLPAPQDGVLVWLIDDSSPGGSGKILQLIANACPAPVKVKLAAPGRWEVLADGEGAEAETPAEPDAEQLCVPGITLMILARSLESG